MGITTAQREERRKHIGSSDIGAIAGVDPWRTPFDVYASKVFELSEIETNEAIEIGNDFEGPLVEWVAGEMGIELLRNVSLKSNENPLFAANLDAAPKDRKKHRFSVEAKTTSNRGEWGSVGTDHMPDRVIAQTQHQMYVANLDYVLVPVLYAEFDRLKRGIWRVDRNDRTIKLLLSEGQDFWNDHVIPKKPPPIEGAQNLDTIKRIPRVLGSSTSVDPSLVEAYETSKERFQEASIDREDKKAKLLAAMGGHEVAMYGSASHVYAFREQTRRTVNSKTLRARHPEIHESVLNENSFRVLRKVKL